MDDVSGGESTISLGFRQTARVWLLWSVTALIGVIGSITSTSASEVPLTVRVGFDQRFKVGQWTPVLVENVPEEATTCEVMVTDPDGVSVIHPLSRMPANAKEQSNHWVGLLRSGRLNEGIAIRIFAGGSEPRQHRRLSVSRRATPLGEDADSVHWDQCFPLRQSEPFWLEVGTKSELLKPVEATQAIRLDVLPSVVDIPWSLDGVDGIWASDGAGLSDTAKVEVERWLERGGHLILTITSDIEEFLKTPWAGILKNVVEPRERTRTSDLSRIEAFTVHGRKITGANRTVVTTLSPRDGQVLVSCLEGPLVIRAGFGFGKVTVLGIDPATTPLSRWDGRSNFVKRLVQATTDTDSSKSPIRTSLSQSGVTDLASQWRAAAINIPEVARPTLWGSLGLLLLCAVVIGPLDYWVVHKVLKRPHWTWTTLPLLVATMSLGIVWLAHAANGDAPKLTQLDLVDIDAGRQEVIARSWATAYATENSLWNVEANPIGLKASHPLRVLSWLGFPEDASGGMYRDSGFDVGHALARSAMDRSSLEGIPLPQWSSKSFTSDATWIAESPLIDAQLTSTTAGELSGSIVHRLPFDLHDWIVVFEKWVYRPHPRLGEDATIWRAGEPWNPKDERNYGRELRGFLQRVTATKLEAKKGSTQEDVLVEKERYNSLNLEPSEILQMMTLHEAAGGKSYTGLEHRSLPAFDVTSLLSLDRAIVIARVVEPTTAWSFNGKPRSPTRHHGFVRLLLPVRPIGDSTKYRRLPKLDANTPQKTESETPANNTDSVPNETKTP